VPGNSAVADAAGPGRPRKPAADVDDGADHEQLERSVGRTIGMMTRADAEFAVRAEFGVAIDEGGSGRTGSACCW